MTKHRRLSSYWLLTISYWLLFVVGCGPSDEETNIYRRDRFFPGGLNVPVALVVGEWAGKPRIMGSAWLIDGGNGALFTAKHVTDAFMNDTIELGGSECKLFLNGRVYDCFVDRVPPLRDAAVLRISSPVNLAELPKPYKISAEKIVLNVGDKVSIQGLHPHLKEIRDANETEGFKDLVVPIFRTFYEQRFGNDCIDREVAFDNLEARIVKLNVRIRIDDQENDPMSELKYQENTYFQIITLRNHKFSFAGLSGGVAIRLNKNGEPEAIGTITAERPVEFDYDKQGDLISPCGSLPLVADTIAITPIEAVKDLVEYARYSN